MNKICFEENNFNISSQPEPIAEVISAVALVALKGRDRAAYRRVTDGSLRKLFFFLLKLEKVLQEFSSLYDRSITEL